eukprot:1182835-Prymnesium_polylepis.1
MRRISHRIARVTYSCTPSPSSTTSSPAHRFRRALRTIFVFLACLAFSVACAQERSHERPEKHALHDAEMDRQASGRGVWSAACPCTWRRSRRTPRRSPPPPSPRRPSALKLAACNRDCSM